jgi:hypothetical protein
MSANSRKRKRNSPSFIRRSVLLASTTVATVSILFAVLFSLCIGLVNARDADLVSPTFVAAQTVKQQCINTCRARYLDCRHQNQFPSFECRDVYQNCTRYYCTGLGPG